MSEKVTAQALSANYSSNKREINRGIQATCKIPTFC
jgi:hypothetical protein